MSLPLRFFAESLPARLVPPVLWMGVIFMLSHQSRLPYPEDVSAKVISTLGHVGVFGILAVLVWWALGATSLPSGRRAVVAVLVAFLYGLADEWHQSFVPGRAPDVRDIVADVTGAILAMLVVRWLERRTRSGRRG